MQTVLMVALGGAIGASLRYLVASGTTRLFPLQFPLGTFTVNIVGGFLMGALAAYLIARGEVGPMRAFLGIGVLGGFTTFSAFSLELFELVEKQAWGLAFGYASASVVLSVAALVAGLAAGRTFT